MSKRPSFQFYPADWKGNAKLRRCSEAARGIWMDVLCVLHDEDEYGIARYDLDELARAAGAKLKLVKELVEKGVLKGAPKNEICAAFIYTPRSGRKDGDPVTLIQEQQGPMWYSSRFVRDEYLRTMRAEHGKNNAPKDAPKPPKGDGSGVPPSSSSSSSSVVSKKEVTLPPPVTETADVGNGGVAKLGFVEAFDQAGRAAYGEQQWGGHRPWPRPNDLTTHLQLEKSPGTAGEFRRYCEFCMRAMAAKGDPMPSSPAYFVQGFARHIAGVAGGVMTDGAQETPGQRAEREALDAEMEAIYQKALQTNGARA